VTDAVSSALGRALFAAVAGHALLVEGALQAQAAIGAGLGAVAVRPGAADGLASVVTFGALEVLGVPQVRETRSLFPRGPINDDGFGASILLLGRRSIDEPAQTARDNDGQRSETGQNHSSKSSISQTTSSN